MWSSLSSGVSLWLKTLLAALTRSCKDCSLNLSIFCNFLLILGAAWFTNANITAARDSSACASTGVHCLKASIILSRKAAGLSFGSCLTEFILAKLVGFLAAALRPAMSLAVHSETLPTFSALEVPAGPCQGKSLINQVRLHSGSPIHPGTFFFSRASDKICSCSSVVKSTCNNCWQSSQVGLWVKRIDSKRSMRPWGFSENEGVWVFQL